MGHRTIQMTMRYVHLVPDHQQSAVDRLVPKRAMAVIKGRSATRTAAALRRGAQIETQSCIKLSDFNVLHRSAKVAELADAPDLGSGG